jgi:pimeloyl-ACP methyl ester carboxylesterase/predicted Zn-dependent protease
VKAKLAPGLLLAAALASGLAGCETLGLQSETAVIDDERYLFMRPWIHYEVAGSGPPMLLVHGFPGDLHTWREVVDPLSKYFEVFRIDLAGFGGSLNPYQDYDLEFYSAQIGAFIREMELGPTIVVGHSVGGAASLDAFLRYPDIVRSIVLIDSAGFDVPGPDLEEDLDRMGRALYNYQGESDMERLVATLIEGPLKKLYGDEKFYDQDEANRLAKALHTRAGRRAYLEVLRNFTPHDVVPRVIAKADELRLHSKSERRGERDILVLWGEKDPWFPPRMAEYFRARIPGAKVAILKGAGHFPHVEQPDVVAGLIVDVMLPRPVADNRFSITNYDADYLISKGRTHKRRKEWAKAIEAFNKALERNPYLGLAYYEIGDLLFQQQQFAEALEMLYRSLEIYPENAMVHYRMGTTFHNQATELSVRLRNQGTDEETIADITEAKMERAVEAYERAAEIDPKRPNPWYNLGRIYTEHEDWKSAARVYGGLAAADPSQARTHRLHVDALLKAKDLKGAAKAIAALSRVERSDPEVFALLGRVRRDSGDLKGAVEALERAVSLDGRKDQYVIDLALVYLTLKNYDEALMNADRVLHKNPGDPQALLIRARLHAQANRWGKAGEDFERVLKSDKKSVEARLGAAQARLRTGDYGKTLSLLEPALRAKRPPTEPLIYVTAAKAHIKGLPEEPPKKKKEKKRVARILDTAADLLASAVTHGLDPEIFEEDADWRPLRRNKKFKAVLKMRPPEPAAPKPATNEEAPDGAEASDDEDDGDSE